MRSTLTGPSWIHTSGKTGIVAPTSGAELEALTCLHGALTHHLCFCLSGDPRAVQSPEWSTLPLGGTLQPSPYPRAVFRL